VVSCSWFFRIVSKLSCFQSGSSEKIRVIYANEKKDNPQLFILTESLTTCEGLDLKLSQSPTPTPLSSEENPLSTEENPLSSEETPWSKDWDLTTQINSDLSHQENLTNLVIFNELAQLECASVRVSNSKVGDSLREIKNIIDGLNYVTVEKLPKQLETLIEDISKLQSRDSEGIDLCNDLMGQTPRGADGKSDSVSSLGLEKLGGQLKKLLEVKERESDKDLMVLEDRRELKIII
jgi:hypothetical protein